MLLKSFLTLFFVGICLSATAVWANTNTEQPLGQVESAVHEIIDILQDPKFAGPERKKARKDRIMLVVKKHFDFREMSKRTLAKNWKKRTDKEKDNFVDLFSQLLERTYIAKVDSYSGEKVVFKKQMIKGKKAIVYSDFIRNNVETPVNYKLKNNAEKWMVYDIIIEGVSLVRNYRTQFDSIIKQEKFSGLLVRMEEKINAPLKKK